MAFVGASQCTLAASSIMLSANHANLTADGSGTSFIPVKKPNYDVLTVNSSGKIDCPQNGQISFDPTSQVTGIGSIVDESGQLATVFDAGFGMGFTLHFGKYGENLKPIGPNHFHQCQLGNDYQVKATFYRSNSPSLIKAYENLAINKQVNLSIGDANQSKKDTATIIVNANLSFARNPEDYSCTLNDGGVRNIYLGNVSVHELETGVPVRRGNSITFALNCPQKANIQVMTMIYDEIDPTNFGANRRTLTNKSGADFAKGVGVQLVKVGDETPIPLARKENQATTMLALDGTQWRLDDNHFLEIGAQLIKTGDITPGKVESKAGILFIYQ